MKRKAVPGILVTLLLMIFLTLIFNIQPVEAETTPLINPLPGQYTNYTMYQNGTAYGWIKVTYNGYEMPILVNVSAEQQTESSYQEFWWHVNVMNRIMYEGTNVTWSFWIETDIKLDDEIILGASLAKVVDSGIIDAAGFTREYWILESGHPYENLWRFDKETGILISLKSLHPEGETNLMLTSTNIFSSIYTHLISVYEEPVEYGGWVDAKSILVSHNESTLFLFTSFHDELPDSYEYESTSTFQIDIDRDTTTGCNWYPSKGIEYKITVRSKGNNELTYIYFEKWNETIENFDTDKNPSKIKMFNLDNSFHGVEVPYEILNISQIKSFDIYVKSYRYVRDDIQSSFIYTLNGNTNVVIDGLNQEWGAIPPSFTDFGNEVSPSEFDVVELATTDNSSHIYHKIDVEGNVTRVLPESFSVDHVLYYHYDTDLNNETGDWGGNEYQIRVRFKGTHVCTSIYTWNESRQNYDFSGWGAFEGRWNETFEWGIPLQYINTTSGDSIRISFSSFWCYFTDVLPNSAVSADYATYSPCVLDEYTMNLKAGWNMVSLPIDLDDPSIEVVLADILDKVTSVWAFDGETKTWSSYSPGAPSDLTEMVDYRGYWIQMTEDDSLTVCGEYVHTGELALFEGWNLIGLQCTPEDPIIEVVFSDILDNINSVWAFDGETKTWSSYAPGAPSDLTEMVDGKGYWIKVSADVLWEIDTG